MFWRKSELKKKMPNIASDDEQHRDVRAGERRVTEEREVEHRQPLVALEQDERRQRDGGDGEQREDPRGCPAVRVRLDQRVREREEPDRRGDEARQVEPLLVRGVAGLVDRPARDDDRRARRPER